MTIPESLDAPPLLNSFVRRQGRLTAAQARALTQLWPQFGYDWQPAQPIDLTTLFAPQPPAPLYLEIGCGNGDALVALALAHPERHYVGVEVHRPGVGHLLLALARHNLHNVRVISHDAVQLLTAVPDASLSGVYLFFPDPWPKLRHHKRRLVQPAFVTLLARVMRSGGTIHMATDWEPYAQVMLQVVDAAEEFVNCAGAGQFAERPAERPITRFERRGQRLGHVVRDLCWQRR